MCSEVYDSTVVSLPIYASPLPMVMIWMILPLSLRDIHRSNGMRVLKMSLSGIFFRLKRSPRKAQGLSLMDGVFMAGYILEDW
jgi:hypothetical protein